MPAKSGVLKSFTNTGKDDELSCIFATPVALISNQPAFVSDSMTLRRRVGALDVQRWELEAAIAQTHDGSNFFVQTVRFGFTDKFYVRPPQPLDLHEFEYNDSLKVVGVWPPGANAFNATGAVASKLQAGHLIKFETDSKVYLVIDPGNNGSGTIVYPRMRTARVPDEKIYLGANVTMTVRINNDMILGIKYVNGIIADHGTYKFVEAL